MTRAERAHLAITNIVNDLMPYLRHERGCLSNDPMEPRTPCDCGLDDVILKLTGRKLVRITR